MWEEVGKEILTIFCHGKKTEEEKKWKNWQECLKIYQNLTKMAK